MHALVTAELAVPRPLMVWREGWGETVTVQALAFLLEDGRHNVLVDTGVGGIETRPGLPQGDYAREGAIWTQLVPGGIVGALAERGLSPNDVDDVVLTHLHYDHAGNVPLFERARVHVAARGLEHAQRAIHPLDARYPADVVAWLQRDGGEHLHAVPDRYEVLPGIEVRYLGGHTRCSQAVVVASESDTYVMPGDVLPLADNLDDAQPTGNYTDLAELIQAGRDLRSWGKVLPSHDPRTPALLDGGAR